MQRSQELLDAYLRGSEEGLRGEPDRNHSSFAELSIIGTDPTEWSVGRDFLAQLDAERAGMKAMFEAGGKVTHEDTAAWAEGDFGWVIDRLTVRAPDGREARLRTTSVCHRENGVWTWVHQHVSIGVPNDQVPLFNG